MSNVQEDGGRAWHTVNEWGTPPDLSGVCVGGGGLAYHVTYPMMHLMLPASTEQNRMIDRRLLKHSLPGRAVKI